MKQVSGKTAFITGGTSGIGLGIAKALLGAGMNVVVAGRHDDHLAEARQELASDRAHALKLDVTDRAAFEAAANEAEQRFGNIHVLCNNAGVGVIGPVEKASYADWDWSIAVNLTGTVNGIVTMLPRILAHGEGGHIVNTASMSGLLPHRRGAIYCATKAAVIAMIEAMRADLEPHGVICSVFCPGAVKTNIASAGQRRPAAYAEATLADARPPASHQDLSHVFQTKEQAGQRVLEGILRDELYILSHSEFRDGVAERLAAIAAAVPDIPENMAYKTGFPGMFSNPVFAAELARRSKGS